MASDKHLEHDRPDESAAIVQRLYGDFERPLKGYFGKRIRDRSQVDDMVQDVFVRLSKRDDLTELERPEAYIFHIAANLVRDRARRKITHRSFTKDLSDRNENFIEEISPERVLQGKRRVLALQNALNELPERTRVIFVLQRFEEFTYKEIGKRLNISTSSVEKHMMQAIKHIKQRMERE